MKRRVSLTSAVHEALLKLGMHTASAAEVRAWVLNKYKGNPRVVELASSGRSLESTVSMLRGVMAERERQYSEYLNNPDCEEVARIANRLRESRGAKWTAEFLEWLASCQRD